MTPKEICDLARTIGIDAEVDGGDVVFCEGFECGMDDDLNDVASDASIDVQERLAEVGLAAKDVDSDNDSVFGKIVEKEPE